MTLSKIECFRYWFRNRNAAGGDGLTETKGRPVEEQRHQGEGGGKGEQYGPNYIVTSCPCINT